MRLAEVVVQRSGVDSTYALPIAGITTRCRPLLGDEIQRRSLDYFEDKVSWRIGITSLWMPPASKAWGGGVHQPLGEL